MRKKKAAQMILGFPAILIFALLWYGRPANTRPKGSLVDAAKSGNQAAIQQHLAAGESANTMNAGGHTPLYEAALNGDTETVHYLLQSGASPNADAKGKNTALDAAAMAGNFAIVQELVAKGADLKPYSNDGQTPLHAAADGGNANIVSFLLDKGLDPNARRTSDHATPICDAASGGRWAAIDVLKSRGGSIDTPGYHRRSPLSLSILRRHRDVSRKLVDAGADINQADADGAKPLQFALIVHDYELAMQLLPKTKDLNAYDRGGRNVLYYAVFYGAPLEVDKALVDVGVSPNQKIKDQTPLIVAKENKDKELLDLLRKAGAKEDK